MSNRKSVLVIDDDDIWRPLFVELLEDEFNVTSASSLDEALQAIVNQHPPYHVVVTDIRYVDKEKENVSGLRFIESLNRLGDFTKAIVITGYPSIETAKMAMGKLAAFDYLEKYPIGKNFDDREFQIIVHRAANAAEQQRPQGLVAPNLRVLLIEPDKTWRKKLLEALKNSPYEIEAVVGIENILENLRSEREEYRLVIFDEIIPKGNPKFFDILQSLMPEAKKIMFTSQDVREIMNAVYDFSIMKVFIRQDDKLDLRDFQRTVHSAFSTEATKYAVINIYEKRDVADAFHDAVVLHVGKTYLLSVGLQNSRHAGSTPIWLTPRPDKRGRIRLEAYIYASQAKLDPGTEAYWDIRLSEQPQPLITEITPMRAGRLKISIEIKFENNWLGTVTKETDVVG